MYSFVIITLNEQNNIEGVINSIIKAGEGFDYEIVVSDGGSEDSTLDILKSYDVKVVNSKTGRGIQYISGVNVSKGDVFIFLHGDTIFPADGLKLIDEEFKKGVKAARFSMKFDKENLLYNFYSWITKFDSAFTSFGIKCIAIDKELYTNIGGFPDWLIFEDVELLSKVRKSTKISSLPSFVITSSRRFETNGIIRQQIINIILVIGFYLGLKHTQLKKIYSNELIVKSEQAIILFAKYPEEGKVKTRLAESIGEQKAAQFSQLCSDMSFKAVKRIGRLDKYVCIADKKNKERFKDWIGDEFKIKFQKGGTLGEKIFNLFKSTFKKKYNKIVFLVTDIPDVSTDIIIKAFLKLENKDFVIGPTTDGSYYLIGMNKPFKDIFQNITFGRSQVLEKTIEKINEMGLSYELLKKLYDIDYYEDLINWSEQNTQKNNTIEKWMKTVEIKKTSNSK